jgi:hypothetical protein
LAGSARNIEPAAACTDQQAEEYPYDHFEHTFASWFSEMRANSPDEYWPFEALTC